MEEDKWRRTNGRGQMEETNGRGQMEEINGRGQMEEDKWYCHVPTAYRKCYNINSR